MTESDDALLLRVAREEIKRQAAEIERLKTRLEVSPDHPYDGVIDSMMTEPGPSPINSAALRAAAQKE